MKIHSLPPQSFESVCYLVTEGGDALLIDAGAPADRIAALLKATETTLRGIVLTHGHFDHILEADNLRDRFGVPLFIHEDDAELLGDAEKNAFSVFFGRSRTWRAADRILGEGDSLRIGDSSPRILHTPGHTRGSVCLLGNGILLAGDTLFAEGYGRYDLYGGDAAVLRRSLLRLASLPNDLAVYSGHGPAARLSDAIDSIAPFIGLY